MSYERRYSLFVSSTYEDLKEERQAVLGVALENGFIPIGMEQFHAAPVDQWEIITKMIDESDFYLLIIGGCYGSIDIESGLSYTEKEYDYAKSKKIKIIAIIEDERSIKREKMDSSDDWKEKQESLSRFREKVRSGGNTVDTFDHIGELKYVLSASLNKLKKYKENESGWVRYSDIENIVNEKIQSKNIIMKEKGLHYDESVDEIKSILCSLSDQINGISNYRLQWEEIPEISEEDIDNLFN